MLMAAIAFAAPPELLHIYPVVGKHASLVSLGELLPLLQICLSMDVLITVSHIGYPFINQVLNFIKRIPMNSILENSKKYVFTGQSLPSRLLPFPAIGHVKDLFKTGHFFTYLYPMVILRGNG
jgi:hypothetical protein